MLLLDPKQCLREKDLSVLSIPLYRTICSFALSYPHQLSSCSTSRISENTLFSGSTHKTPELFHHAEAATLTGYHFMFLPAV